MTRRTFTQLPAAALTTARRILDPESFRHHVDFFNGMVKEDVVNYIPDAGAWPWMKRNIPFFTCPDPQVEQIYYYRWWTFRKHIKKTPAGFLITEFLQPVKHAGQYNALSCAFGHHVAEARWLRDSTFVEDDVHFWLRGGEKGGLHPNFHQFSGWAAVTLLDSYLVHGNRAWLTAYLDALILDYQTWERDRLLETGLFWQRDVSDGMEESISGGRRVKNARPSINSYMYGNAKAIAAIAEMAGDAPVARDYRAKADQLRRLVETKLWNPEARFFETALESGKSSEVREQIGFTPWYFDLPTDGKGFEEAWSQLMDPKGFYAPFGPTTAEQRHPAFRIAYEGDDCQWNGPSWPFATTITLKALANVLDRYHQNAVTAEDYFKTLLIYTRSQHLKLIPWIDEDLDPFTGAWIARVKKIRSGAFYGRGDHYNHSCYADLVITGLAGLRPRADSVVEINPLVPQHEWDWFCLDRIPYHGRLLTILWDKTGDKFHQRKGLVLFADGAEIARARSITRLQGELQ
jgi:hypothetical protein